MRAVYGLLWLLLLAAVDSFGQTEHCKITDHDKRRCRLDDGTICNLCPPGSHMDMDEPCSARRQTVCKPCASSNVTGTTQLYFTSKYNSWTSCKRSRVCGQRDGNESPRPVRRPTATTDTVCGCKPGYGFSESAGLCVSRTGSSSKAENCPAGFGDDAAVRCGPCRRGYYSTGGSRKCTKHPVCVFGVASPASATEPQTCIQNVRLSTTDDTADDRRENVDVRDGDLTVQRSQRFEVSSHNHHQGLGTLTTVVSTLIALLVVGCLLIAAIIYWKTRRSKSVASSLAEAPSCDFTVNSKHLSVGSRIVLMDAAQLIEEDLEEAFLMIENEIGQYWRDLARQFACFSETDLDCISHDYPQLREQIHQVLRLWRERVGFEADLNSLLKSLSLLGFRSLAARIVFNVETRRQGA